MTPFLGMLYFVVSRLIYLDLSLPASFACVLKQKGHSLMNFIRQLSLSMQLFHARLHRSAFVILD